MTAPLRILLLALALTWTLVAGPDLSAAAAAKVHRQKGFRLRVYRSHWPHLPRVAVPPRPLGERAAAYARRFLGVPYRFGGASPRSGFDCSGLVRYVYSRFGIDLPHSSYADFGLGRRVPRGALRPGDLVFFDGVGHVGMYVGRGRFIHAPHSGTRVQISRVGEWGTFVGARRVVGAAGRRLLGR